MSQKVAHVIAALLLGCCSAHALDVKRTHVWLLSESDAKQPPKIGLAQRDVSQRGMPFENLYMECTRGGGVKIDVWPFKSSVAATDNRSNGLMINGIQYPLKNWNTGWNEEDRIMMGTARMRNLGLVKAMIGATTLELAVGGTVLSLPPASRALSDFVKQCVTFSHT